MKEYARATRVKYGRKAVEPGLSDALTSQKEKLRAFYTYEMTESTKVQQKAKTKTEVTQEQPYIHCTDIDALWTLIIELRKITKDDEEITIGIDDGQEMLKIMCTIHNVVAASFFPAQVSSIQLARDIEFSIFAEVERLV